MLDFGLGFKSAAERVRGEEVERMALVARELRFNISFLDDALGGILPHDLIVLGARTGAGKTAMAAIIAQETAKAGKRVAFFALEAEQDEIERRMKYRALADRWYSLADLKRDSYRNAAARLSYRDWYYGRIKDLLDPLDRDVEDEIARTYSKLSTYYRGAAFTLEHLDRQFRAIQDQTDLIILDHLHYVDTDEGESENRAYKAIVKRIRDISLTIGIPVILIAHLRKRDRGGRSPIPDIDDFHGTSDVTKIATKVIMLAPKQRLPTEKGLPHLWETYVTIPKDRMDGTTSRYVGTLAFNVRTGSYEPAYELGQLNGDAIEDVPSHLYPHWARQR
jgi:replicative DNA helicase